MFMAVAHQVNARTYPQEDPRQVVEEIINSSDILSKTLPIYSVSREYAVFRRTFTLVRKDGGEKTKSEYLLTAKLFLEDPLLTEKQIDAIQLRDVRDMIEVIHKDTSRCW